jgi:hypothetical protein
MPSVPASADPGRDEDPAWLDRDPMTAAEREALLDRLCAQDDDPFDAPEEYWDPESSAPPPGEDELTADELAGVREAAGDEMLGLDAASTGRRGPGQAGSAWTPRTASTGTRPAATTPGSGSGTCPRSGTRPAPARCAGDPPGPATSSTTPHTRRAAGPACVMAARSVVMTTGSSNSRVGRSISFRTGRSAGPHRPGAATTPNRPGTPSSGPRTRSR